jgi:calmodulin
MDRLSAEEIAEFREIFNLVDKDGQGSINKSELADLMETLGIKAEPEEIDQMIAEIDQGKVNVSLLFPSRLFFCSS